jgi:hypothetical protein
MSDVIILWFITGILVGLLVAMIISVGAMWLK